MVTERRDEEIRALVRAGLDSAWLPRLSVKERVYVTPSDGSSHCSLYRVLIPEQHYLYEVDTGGIHVRVHYRCFRVWHEESARPGGNVSDG